MYLVKTPMFIQSLFPAFTWRMPTPEKVIYLTFDDGPIPEVTPWVLAQLKKYDAKATFFCVGANVEKNQDIFQQVLQAGHTVGNHTYSHLNGWETENIDYFHNIRHCARLVKTSLFRPPYGRISPKQTEFVQRHYDVVMWDVLSGDFDNDITPEDCFLNVINHAKAGSIIVFHDNVKAQNNLYYTLPRALAYFAEQGYVFKSITPELIKASNKSTSFFSEEKELSYAY
jgi:peptidoglycan-N-acetylglucosamine deacetylase